MDGFSAARYATVLVVGLALCGGCKKQQPQETAAPQAAPTSAAAPAARQTAPTSATTPAQQGKSGEALFKDRCAACHPNGGNTMKPKLTLKGKDLAAHNITTADDIVKLMRNPGQGMPKFDQATVSDQDAQAIANYILEAFK